jgi:hypothetical protein
MLGASNWIFYKDIFFACLHFLLKIWIYNFTKHEKNVS